MLRKDTRRINAGRAAIGGGARVSVQSMTNTKTDDVAATLGQIERLRNAGCDIVRLAVPNMRAARALYDIKAACGDIPIVADIHFDYRLALEAVKAGVDKIRINPGNIGGDDRVRAVAKACLDRGVPIRIGVNGGSLEPELLEKYSHPTAEAMVESAARHVRLLEKFGFEDICISLKASSVPVTVEAYRLAARSFPYPLHLGVTESGTAWNGTVQSAVGIGALLMEGIGDTIRVSLTADPEEEVRAGIAILKAAGLRESGPRLVSCPTCGRCGYDQIGTAQRVEKRLADVDRDITVAVMGCIVNGPGEAKNADYGIAGAAGKGVIFRRGEVIGTFPEAELVEKLFEIIESGE